MFPQVGSQRTTQVAFPGLNQRCSVPRGTSIAAARCYKGAWINVVRNKKLQRIAIESCRDEILNPSKPSECMVELWVRPTTAIHMNFVQEAALRDVPRGTVVSDSSMACAQCCEYSIVTYNLPL